MSSNGDEENMNDFYESESVILSFMGSDGEFGERSIDDIQYDNYRMELKTSVHEILESVMKLRIKLENIEAKLKKHLNTIQHEMKEDFEQK